MEQTFKTIDRYLSSGKHTPIIVDVCSSEQLFEIKSHYEVGSNRFIKTSDFCAEDSFPKEDEMFHRLSLYEGEVFLTGVSSFLKLQGKMKLRSMLREFLDLALKGKLVILTYQCRDYLDFGDPRLRASSRIVTVDCDKPTSPPKVYFFGKEQNPSIDPITVGIENFSSVLEDFPMPENIYVKTKFRQSDLCDSLIGFRQIVDSYDLLTLQYPEISNLEKTLGEESNWKELADELYKQESWSKFVAKEFGGSANLTQCLTSYSSFSSIKKWYYMISLKYYGVGDDKYLQMVMNGTKDLKSFERMMYQAILDIDNTDKNFEELYRSRKEYVKGINNVQELLLFCKEATAKEKNSLYYLTDNTDKERQCIINMIVKYEKELHKELIEDILQKIYPDLYYYLMPFVSGIDAIDEYIQLYKYCKLTNQILPEMMDKVEYQAEKREYNTLLKARSYYLDKTDKKRTEVYFIDALGIEFLGFIQQKCYELDLKMKANIARCELPSITSINKYFVDDLQEQGVNVTSISEIDELKHNDNINYDYQKIKTPIHIEKELRLISEYLSVSIYNKLLDGKIDKVIVASDHGASRLAIIYNVENKIVAEEKGEHSGRCCLKSDISEKPMNATEENGYWCLANYEQFKGGRKHGVELHGGATIEEVAVPVIEIALKDRNVECHLTNDSKKVSFSYKKKVQLKLFIDTKSNDVQVVCNGIMYDCKPTDTEYVFKVEIPEIKKKGGYNIDVRIDGFIVARDITFEAKSEGASERRYF